MRDASFARLPPPGRGSFGASLVAPEGAPPMPASIGERLGKRVAVGAAPTRVALSDPGGFKRWRPMGAKTTGGALVYRGDLAQHPGEAITS